MSANKTLKSIREEAEQLIERGVTKREHLLEALPVLIRFQEAAASAARTAKECREVAKALSDKCSAYALEHQTVFADGLYLAGNGVSSGDVTDGDATYHFAGGYDAPKRIDGDAISQSFLTGLPEGWTKAKLEIDTTGIKRLNVSSEDLEKQGLYRPAKNVWS